MCLPIFSRRLLFCRGYYFFCYAIIFFFWFFLSNTRLVKFTSDSRDWTSDREIRNSPFARAIILAINVILENDSPYFKYRRISFSRSEFFLKIEVHLHGIRFFPFFNDPMEKLLFFMRMFSWSMHVYLIRKRTFFVVEILMCLGLLFLTNKIYWITKIDFYLLRSSLNYFCKG